MVILLIFRVKFAPDFQDCPDFRVNCPGGILTQSFQGGIPIKSGWGGKILEGKPTNSRILKHRNDEMFEIFQVRHDIRFNKIEDNLPHRIIVQNHS